MKKLFSLAFMAMLVPFAVDASTCDIESYGYTDEYIQCLIDGSSEGDTVVIPEGTYAVDSTINVNKSITLTAEADVELVISNQIKGIYITGDVVNVSNFTISYVDGIEVTAKNKTHTIMVGASNSYEGTVVIDKMTIESLYEAVVVYGTKSFTLTNSTISLTNLGVVSGGYGVKISASDYALIDGNIIDASISGNNIGISVLNDGVAEIINNTISASVYGIYMPYSTANNEIINIDTVYEDNTFGEDTPYEIVNLLYRSNLYVFDKDNYNQYSWGSSFIENNVEYINWSTYYGSVEDALTDASNNSVTVFSGEYSEENLVIEKDVNLIVREGAVITLSGDLTVVGTIENNGTIIVNGDVDLTGTYSGEGVISVEVKDLVVADPTDTTYSVDTKALQSVIASTIASNSDYSKLVMGHTNVTVDVEIEEVDVDDVDLDSSIKTAIEAINTNSEGTVATFFDINLLVSSDNLSESFNITELDDTITITIDLPEDLAELEDGYEREYYILSYHGEEVISVKGVVSEDGKTVTFEADSFSVYALTFIDSEVSSDTEADVDADVTTDTEADVDADVTTDVEADVEADEDVENPSTGDAIVTALVIGSVSLIALVGVSKKLKKN